MEPPSAAMPLRPGHAAPDEVGGDRREIVVRQALALAPAGFVPARAELAAAADVGDDAGAAALQPELADRGAVIAGSCEMPKPP